MKLQRSRQHGRTSGFTLIELLVVIAIISILATILLPSLQEARELARNGVCVSTVRNLGVSFQNYLMDYKTYTPYAMSGPGIDHTNNHWYKRLVNDGYMTGQEAMFCPNHESQRSQYALYISSFVSYGLSMGLWWNYGGAGSSPASPDDFASPSDTIVTAESALINDPSGFGGCYAIYPIQILNVTLHARHQDKICNVLWGDAHVSSVETADPSNSDAGLYDSKALTSIYDTDNYWDRK